MSRWLGRVSGLVRSHGLACLVGLVSLVLAAGGSWLVSAPAEAAPGPDRTSDPGTSAAFSDQAADRAAGQAALARAKASGEPVVVDALTTPTEVVSAQPGGFFRDKVAPAPVRVKKAGGWHDLDPGLAANADGTWSPAFSIGSLKVSGGGPAGSMIASYSVDGVGYEVRSPWPLPAPRVSGAQARFVDVIEGVDLVVVADESGFSHNWVIKTRAAAADPRMSVLSLPVTMVGLSPHPKAGGVSFNDGGGIRRLWTPAPVMWDSSGKTAEGIDARGGGAGDPVEDGPGPGDSVAKVAVGVSGDRLTLRPDEGLLSDPATVFPVVVDPTVTTSAYRNGWTAVWKNYPSTSFWYTSHSLGAGYEGFEQDKVVRSYFRYNTTAFRGKHVLGAAVDVVQIHDASCSPRVTRLYRTGAIGGSTTWNHQPARYGLADTSSSIYGCGSGTGTVGFDVTDEMTTIANGNLASATFMLRAANESDKVAWKQFNNYSFLVVDYVVPPTAPTSPGFTTPAGLVYACQTVYASEPYVYLNPAQVTMHAKVADATPGASLQGLFFRAGGSDTVSLLSSTVASPGVAYRAWPGLAEATSYAFKIANRLTWTYQGVAGHLDSVTSPAGGRWCYLRADLTGPTPPSLSLVGFTACADPSDPTQCPADGQVGTPGQITVGDTDPSVARYLVYLNGTLVQTVPRTGTSQTITITPEALSNKLEVYAQATSWLKTSVETHFRVDPVPPVARWRFDGSDAGGLSYSGAGAVPISDRGRVGDGFAAPGGAYAASTLSQVPSTGDFSVTAWVRLAGDTPATVLAASGTSSDAVSVSYDPTAHAWTLDRAASDGGAVSHAASGAVAVPGVWTHLGLTYDATSHVSTLYVNGHQATTLSGALWSNAGRWRFGCGTATGGQPRACMSGQLDDLEVYDAVLPVGMLSGLADPKTGGRTGTPRTVTVSGWAMNEADGAATVTDAKGQQDLAVAGVDDGSGDPTFGPDPDGEPGVLFLHGLSGQSVQAPGPVVDGTGSFSVSAWFELAADTHSGVVAQQHGADGVTWTLAYRTGGTGGPAQAEWVFSRTSGDGPGATITEVVTPAGLGSVDEWTNLTGVYDRAADTLRLYLAGAAAADSAGAQLPPLAFADPWQGRGTFEVGNGTLDGAAAPFEGKIGGITLQVGAMDEDQVAAEYACNPVGGGLGC